MEITKIEKFYNNDIRIHYSDGSSLFISSERLIDLRMRGKKNLFFKSGKHYTINKV